MTILERLKSESPKLFVNIRYIGYMIALIAGAIAGLATSSPETVAFLPQWVINWSMLIAALSGAGLGAAVISHLPVKDNPPKS